MIELPKERAEFVNEVSDFVDRHYPKSLRNKQLNRKDFTRADYKRWHGILDKAGWGACHWPCTMAALVGMNGITIYSTARLFRRMLIKYYHLVLIC